ncbi:MAG: HAD-IA family hydrolase [Clostridia bacterium]|nr:HAD-IA family hydrolase [Clostridia bacterium]
MMNKVKKLTTVFWDFDGTLVNTNDVILESFKATYIHYYGETKPVEYITRFFGEPLYSTMAREFPDMDAEGPVAYYREFQKENADQLVKEIPGIREILETMERMGVRQFIVTSRTRESTLNYLRMFDMEKYFIDMVTCDDDIRPKPDADPALKALSKAGCAKDEVIMVGDGLFDIKCANNAMIPSCLVGWRITGDTNDRVGDAAWDYYTETPEDLRSLLTELAE